jgi:hypothetical protein
MVTLWPLVLLYFICNSASSSVYWWDAVYCQRSLSTTLLIPLPTCNPGSFGCHINEACLTVQKIGNICGRYEMNTAYVFIEIPGRIDDHVPGNGWYKLRDGSSRNFTSGFMLRNDVGHNCGRNGWLSLERLGVVDCQIIESGDKQMQPVSDNSHVELAITLMGPPPPPDAPPVTIRINQEFSIDVTLDSRYSNCAGDRRGINNGESYTSQTLSFAADLASYFITASLPPCSSHSHPDADYCSHLDSRASAGTSYWSRCCGSAQAAKDESGGDVVSSWRYFESVPPASMLRPLTASTSSSIDAIDRNGVEPLRIFSSVWKEKSFPSLSQAAGETSRRHVCLYFSAQTTGMAHKLLHMIRSLPRSHFAWTFFACVDNEDEGDVSGSIIPDLLREGERERGGGVEVRHCMPTVEVTPADMRARPRQAAARETCVGGVEMCVQGEFRESSSALTLEEFSTKRYGPDRVDTKIAFEYAVQCLQDQLDWGQVPRWSSKEEWVVPYSAEFVKDLTGFVSSSLSPRWVARLWTSLLNTVLASSLPCEALVTGNERSAMAALIPGVAQLLGIPR